MKKINKIQVFRNSRNKWQWRIKWKNNEIGCCSEEYTVKYGACKSARKLYDDLDQIKWYYEILK